MDDNEKLYRAAMQRIDELVDEVLQIVNYVSEENMYERDWVISRFREKFNEKVKEIDV